MGKMREKKDILSGMRVGSPDIFCLFCQGEKQREGTGPGIRRSAGGRDTGRTEKTDGCRADERLSNDVYRAGETLYCERIWGTGNRRISRKSEGMLRDGEYDLHSYRASWTGKGRESSEGKNESPCSDIAFRCGKACNF